MNKKDLFSTAKIALSAEKQASSRRALNALRELVAKNAGLKMSTERLLERREYQRRYRNANIPKSRRCPNCGITKVARSRWSNSGVCLSCYRIPKADFEDPKFVSEPVYEVPKGALNYPISEIADECGWSRFVAKRAKEQGLVPAKYKSGYEKVYGRLLYAKKINYRAQNLTKCRVALSMSAKDFAKHMGWTESKQYRIEAGKATLTPEQVTKLVKFIGERKPKT